MWYCIYGTIDSTPPTISIEQPLIATPTMLQRLSSLAVRRPRAAMPSSSSAWSIIVGAQSQPSFALATQLPPPQTTTTTIRPRSSRSTRGLYDGRDVRFGNNVPFSLKKTRRKWNPNVQHKVLYSSILDEMIKFKVTTGALRTIDKMGGLDNYLLTSKHVIETKTKGVGKEGQGQ